MHCNDHRAFLPASEGMYRFRQSVLAAFPSRRRRDHRSTWTCVSPDTQWSKTPLGRRGMQRRGDLRRTWKCILALREDVPCTQNVMADALGHPTTTVKRSIAAQSTTDAVVTRASYDGLGEESLTPLGKLGRPSLRRSLAALVRGLASHAA